MKWLARMFTPSQRQARLAAQQASAEAERARKLTEAAMVDSRDSESARSAYDERMRRLARASSLAGTDRGGGMARAPVGYKMLTGQ